MGPTTILWGQMAAALSAVLIGLWGATEWTAWRLGFQPALGSVWFISGGLPIYEPAAFFVWWYEFDHYAPRVFVEGAGFAAAGGVLAVVVAVTGSVIRARHTGPVTTYGSARWATRAEVEAAGLTQHA